MKAKYAIEEFWADPEAAQNISMFQAAGLPVSKADNHVNEGIMSLACAFHPHNETKEPKLYLMSNCTNSIIEIINYHWQEDPVTGGTRERPVKMDDHTCDAIRYLIHSVKKYGQFDPEPEYDVV
jgi:phage terminase large subunit